MSLTAEEKRRFLKALEEDPEFRYAVAVAARLDVIEKLYQIAKDVVERRGS